MRRFMVVRQDTVQTIAYAGLHEYAGRDSVVWEILDGPNEVVAPLFYATRTSAEHICEMLEGKGYRVCIRSYELL